LKITQIEDCPNYIIDVLIYGRKDGRIEVIRKHLGGNELESRLKGPDLFASEPRLKGPDLFA
jgi:hypothetical protein